MEIQGKHNRYLYWSALFGGLAAAFPYILSRRFVREPFTVSSYTFPGSVKPISGAAFCTLFMLYMLVKEGALRKACVAEIGRVRSEKDAEIEKKRAEVEGERQEKERLKGVLSAAQQQEVSDSDDDGVLSMLEAAKDDAEERLDEEMQQREEAERKLQAIEEKLAAAEDALQSWGKTALPPNALVIGTPQLEEARQLLADVRGLKATLPNGFSPFQRFSLSPSSSASCSPVPSPYKTPAPLKVRELRGGYGSD